jgi:hypothetical protein
MITAMVGTTARASRSENPVHSWITAADHDGNDQNGIEQEQPNEPAGGGQLRRTLARAAHPLDP